MLEKQVIVILTLYLSTIFIKNAVISEWIELPQFSDKTKIYRKSTIKFDVMKVNNLLNVSKNLFFNVTNHTNCDSEGLYGDILLKPSKISVPTDFDQLNDSDRNKNDENFPIHQDILNTHKNFSKISENNTNELENKPIDSSTQLYITTKSPFFDFTEDKSKSNKKKQSYSYYLLNYIPINQLKRVHTILIENLGKTHKEKLQFLQSFKNDLSKTIRSMIPGKRIFIIHCYFIYKLKYTINYCIFEIFIYFYIYVIIIFYFSSKKSITLFSV